MKPFLATVLVLLLFTGCATNRVDWNARVGNYNYDQAVLELGPPEGLAQLSDGSRVGDWLISRGRVSGGGGYFITRHGYWVNSYPYWEGPDHYMRLTFDPQGRLTAAKQVLK